MANAVIETVNLDALIEREDFETLSDGTPAGSLGSELYLNIHGQADAIRSFLQDHKSELDKVEQLKNQQFMNHDQWKTNRT